MIVRVTPSIDRPWKDGGGFYSCDFFPETRFTELSPRTEVRQVRDAAGRWRRVRGVRAVMGQAAECPALAFRGRDPLGVEGYVVVGGDLGVMMYGVGQPGVGSPILWVDEAADFRADVARVLAEPRPGDRPEDGGVISLDAIRPAGRQES